MRRVMTLRPEEQGFAPANQRRGEDRDAREVERRKHLSSVSFKKKTVVLVFFLCLVAF